jgi:putative component of membrane protein insertase Oxa1/YidC/SpoIIIJ protein YidD
VSSPKKLRSQVAIIVVIPFLFLSPCIRVVCLTYPRASERRHAIEAAAHISSEARDWKRVHKCVDQ